MLGAAGLFGQLKDALNTIWNVQPKSGGGILAFVEARFLSMAMVLGIGFLLLVTLVFDAAISAMGPVLRRLVGGEALIHVLSLVLSFAIATVLFAAIFHILPDLKIAWRDVWLGALFTSLLSGTPASSPAEHHPQASAWTYRRRDARAPHSPRLQSRL